MERSRVGGKKGEKEARMREGCGKDVEGRRGGGKERSRVGEKEGRREGGKEGRREGGK